MKSSSTIKILRIGDSHLVQIPDGLVSIDTTKHGSSIFGFRERITVYRAGALVVNIPIETLREVLDEAEKHIRKNRMPKTRKKTR